MNKRRLALVFCVSFSAVLAITKYVMAATSAITFPTPAGMAHHAGNPCYDQASCYWMVYTGTGHTSYKIKTEWQCYYGGWHQVETVIVGPAQTEEGSMDATTDLNHTCANTNLTIPMRVNVQWSDDGVNWTNETSSTSTATHP